MRLMRSLIFFFLLTLSASSEFVCDDYNVNCANMELDDHLGVDISTLARRLEDAKTGKEYKTNSNPHEKGSHENWWTFLLRGRKKFKNEETEHKPQDATSHVMMIDAGSGGSRLHVYEYDRRIFSTLPPPITDVNTDNKWTKRLKPGLSAFSNVKKEEVRMGDGSSWIP